MIRTIARPMLASVFILDGVSVLRNPADRAAATAPAVEKIQKTANKAADAAPESVSKISAPAPAVGPKNAVRALAAVKIGAGALFALGKAPRLSATVLAVAHAPNMVARFSDTPGGTIASTDGKVVGLATDGALLGALFLAAGDTAGKPGLRWRAQAAKGEVSAALPAIKGEARSLRSALEDTAHTLGHDARKVAGAVSDQSGNASQALANVTENVGENLPENAKHWQEKASTAASSLAEKATAAGQNLTERAKNVDTQGVLDEARNRIADFDVKAQSEKLRDNAAPYLDSAREQAKSARKQAKAARADAVEKGGVFRARAERRAKKAEADGRALRKKAEAKAKAKAEATFGK